MVCNSIGAHGYMRQTVTRAPAQLLPAPYTKAVQNSPYHGSVYGTTGKRLMRVGVGNRIPFAEEPYDPPLTCGDMLQRLLPVPTHRQ